MTVSLTHNFVSGKSNGSDPTLVQPSNWNDQHVLTLAAGNLLGRATGAGTGAVTEIPIGVDTAGHITIPSGTATAAPLTLTSGTNLTTAAAGSLEYDGKVTYVTPQGTQRGVVPGQQTYVLNSAVTGSNATGNQSLFGLTNGVTLSANTVYAFEISASLAKTAGTTNHNLSLLFGGTATLNNISYNLTETDSAGAVNTLISSTPDVNTVFVYLGSAASTSGTGWQKVPLNTVSNDTLGWWNSTSTYIQPTIPGWYWIAGRARALTTLSTIAVGKNGAQNQLFGHDTGGNSAAVAGSLLIYLNGTDYVDLRVYAASSGVAYSADSFDTWMQVTGPIMGVNGFNGSHYLFSNTASSTAVTGNLSSANQIVSVLAKGIVSVNAGGTFLPEYALSAAPGGAYSTQVGSYMTIYPIGASGSNINVGTWS